MSKRGQFEHSSDGNGSVCPPGRVTGRSRVPPSSRDPIGATLLCCESVKRPSLPSECARQDRRGLIQSP